MTDRSLRSSNGPLLGNESSILNLTGKPTDSIRVKGNISNTEMTNTMKSEQTFSAPLTCIISNDSTDYLTHDPRTGLQIIDIPEEFEHDFTELRGSVIHWFSLVQKVNRHWRAQQRICFLSDNALYLCMNYGGITRCVLIETMKELLLIPPSGLGIRIEAPDYDMLLTFSNEKDRDAVVSILERITRNNTGRSIAYRTISGEKNKQVEHLLMLQKPTHWNIKIEPLKKRETLLKIVHERTRREEKDRLTLEREQEHKLALEVMRQREEDQERFKIELSHYERLLEEKNRRIHALEKKVNRGNADLLTSRPIAVDGTSSCSLPEVCMNCRSLQHALERTPSEDKRYVRYLEDQLEQQKMVLEHYKKTMHIRCSSNTPLIETVSTQQSEVMNLSQELFQARAKIAELQRLIILNLPPGCTSPIDVELRNLHMGSRTTPLPYGKVSKSMNTKDEMEVSRLKLLLVEKEAEIKHLKHTFQTAHHQINFGEGATMQRKLEIYNERIKNSLRSILRDLPGQSGFANTDSVADMITTAARDAVLSSLKLNS